jgi:CubicO group peptidase (beta-lactamase class C family)
MKKAGRRPKGCLLILPLALCAFLQSPAEAQRTSVLPDARPEDVGFSSERLRRFDAVMRKMVDDKEFAGIVTMTARHGKVFQSKAYGLMDIARGAPMEKDTLFRIASMSKPITGVAMMILYEEGKWSPQDPILKYIPEFANLKVFKGLDKEGKILLEDPAHLPTMRELMSHTAGFSYGDEKEPVNKLYKQQDVLGSDSLQEMIKRLSTIPLLYQPGTRWVYSVSADIQGYLVQKLSGEPLPQFLKERIFDPLEMTDTGFLVPKEKRDRFATVYDRTEQGELTVVSASEWGLSYDREPGLPSGGMGLVSTAGDYLKFAQMLLNGGELGRVRLLGPVTVKMMSANQLPETIMASDWTQSNNLLPYGWGFGFDVGVLENPALLGRPCGKGTFFWAGGGGVWFWVDPTDDVVSVGMVQRSNAPEKVNFGELPQQLIYQALVELGR